MTWNKKDTVIVPIDFSEKSIAAIDTALEIAARPQGVHVVHVMADLTPMDVNHVMAALDVAGRRHHAEETVRQRLSDPKYRDVRIMVLMGDPGNEITAYAEQMHAQLIVLPSNGRTGISRWLIGSVAERVVRRAHCPVLTVRERA